MILLDPRIGSGDLVGPLNMLGVPARLEHLDYGDARMVGQGPEGRPVLIGVEIKAIGDLLRCIADKRFVGGQLGGMLSQHEIAFLLIEGVITASPSRELLVLKGREWKTVSFGERRWTYEAVMSWTHSVRRAGIHDVYTADRRATAAWLASLYTNWSKPYEEHKTLIGRLGKPLESAPGSENALATYDAPAQMQVAAALARGIGWEKATAVVRWFKSIRRMVGASQKEWEQVPGIGPKLASQAIATIDKEIEI